jgi:hypothetical protein
VEPSDEYIDALLAQSDYRLTLALAELAGATFALREVLDDWRDQSRCGVRSAARNGEPDDH